MQQVFIQVLFWAALLGGAAAKSAECIVAALSQATQTLQSLDCAVQHFHHCGDGFMRDVKPLLRIYHLNAELDDQLGSLVEDLQTSHNFSTEDSETILLALGGIYQPVIDTLGTFRGKYDEFVSSIGTLLTHRVIGGNIRTTRCLAMDVLRSFECRADPTFSKIVSATRAELDKEFQKVLSIY